MRLVRTILAAFAPIQFESFIDPFGCWILDYPTLTDHAPNRPRRVSPAREPEQINLVVCLISLGQKLIGLFDFAIQTPSANAAAPFIEELFKTAIKTIICTEFRQNMRRLALWMDRSKMRPATYECRWVRRGQGNSMFHHRK